VRDPESPSRSAPESVGALAHALAVSTAAAAVGFDWPDVDGVRAKLVEELAELDDALASGDPAHIEEELGDVLFTLVNLGRFLPVGAEPALWSATGRFTARFAALQEALAGEGLTPATASAAHAEAVWRALKPRESSC
jgi:ATP diphosphatase